MKTLLSHFGDVVLRVTLSLVIASVLLVSCVTPAVRAATAPTLPASLTVMQWNVAGATIHNGSTSDGMTKQVVSIAMSRGAHIVALNELCFNQYKSIQKQFQDKHFTTASSFSRFSASYDTWGRCQGGAFGNAIFSKYEISGSTTVMLEQSAQETEKRNLLCASLANSVYMACVTHITTKTDLKNGVAVTVSQLRQVLAFAESYQASRHVIVAGDFNAQPNYGRMNMWYSKALNTTLNKDNYGYYREADDTDSRCPGYGEHTIAKSENTITCGSSGKRSKIDFIFFRENHVKTYHADVADAPKCSGGALCSDHRYLIGKVTFKPLQDPN